jgi:predicted lipid-binding transport protein (Tim44 family)
MSEGFAYIDILFFAMVAAFIAFRLRNVLGRRTGHERRNDGWSSSNPSPSSDNVVALPDRSTSADAERAFAGMADGAVKTGLTQIRLADPHFDLQQFRDGAGKAFEMIVESYAAGDKATLQPLLAPDVFAGFSQAIDDRLAAGHTLDTQVIAVRAVDVVAAAMRDTFARISVRFTSEQVNVVRDAAGGVVEGDASVAEEVVDIWTFERDTSNDDPNWILVETRAPA